MPDTCRRADLVLAVLAAIAGRASGVRHAAQVEAVPGQPFGVAEVTIDYPPADVHGPAGQHGLQRHVARSASRLSGFRWFPDAGCVTWQGPPPGHLTVLFLFRGDDPFDVTIRTPTAQTVHVVPTQPDTCVAGSPAAPLVAHLQRISARSILGRRLSRPWPRPTCHRCWHADWISPLRWWSASRPEQPQSEGRQTLELLAGAEALRMQILKNTCLGLDLDTQPASLPRPTPPAWRQLTFETLPDGRHRSNRWRCVCRTSVSIVRFGQYTNYIWLNALHGGLRGRHPQHDLRARRAQRQ